MNVELTTDSLYRVTWPGGQLWLNLVPMNPAAARTSGLAAGWASVRPEGVLANSLMDLVGVVGLELAGCPRVPRICWDNREHHFWDGFEGVYEPRNVVVNEPRVERQAAANTVIARCYYIANFVKTTLEWRFRRSATDPGKPEWDTRITVENLGSQVLRNYLQLFACYHAPGTNEYWDSSGTITPCGAGGFTAVATTEQEQRLRASTMQRHCERYRGDSELAYARYRWPMLLSQPRPWFGGMRHVIMVEPTTCAAMVTWAGQARDYLIRPPNYDLRAGAAFTTRVRHGIAAGDNPHQLVGLWRAFQSGVDRT